MGATSAMAPLLPPQRSFLGPRTHGWAGTAPGASPPRATKGILLFPGAPALPRGSRSASFIYLLFKASVRVRAAAFPAHLSLGFTLPVSVQE